MPDLVFWSLRSREPLQSASTTIWVPFVCKLRLWGCWYVPNAELGHSQSMPPDLRFGKRSGIISSRHSLDLLARMIPFNRTCFDPDACRIFYSSNVWPPCTAGSLRAVQLCHPPGLVRNGISQPAERNLQCQALCLCPSQSCPTYISIHMQLFPIMPVYSFKS